MAVEPAVRFPVYGIVRILSVAATAAILYWAVHFRGGMTLSPSVEDKLLLFNVMNRSLVPFLLFGRVLVLGLG
jgi:cytochrome b-561